MAFTYDLTTDRGRVRLLITDRKEAGHIFEDEEIDAFLAMEDNSVRRAAAQALDTIATDEALVLKVITLLDLQTDGASLSRELRQRAKQLRDDENAAGAFDWAEQVIDPFSADERIWNQALREDL